MSKILRVNMSDLTAKFEAVPDKYKFLGGRGLTSAITCDEVPPTCHPLGPNNKITFAPGILTGSSAPTAGRLSVGCKSPLTGGIKEANSGGIAADKLARIGIKAIIVEGQPKEKGKFQVLTVNKDGAKLMPAAAEWIGKGLYETYPKMLKKFGRRQASSALASPGKC
jgi:aldehyde:ferredoxin oxidoreductase